jgi:hypothetical protein
MTAKVLVAGTIVHVDNRYLAVWDAKVAPGGSSLTSRRRSSRADIARRVWRRWATPRRTAQLRALGTRRLAQLLQVSQPCKAALSAAELVQRALGDDLVVGYQRLPRHLFLQPDREAVGKVLAPA